jgi:chlorobactene glucosyltransferase
MMLSLILLILSLVFLGVAIFNITGWPKVGKTEQAYAGQVSLLIPARNEEDHLPECLEAALKQDDSVAEILIYNDHSTDGTAAVIKTFALRDHRVRSIGPIPLPPGWCGKNFACAQLAEASQGDRLLFIDADTHLTQGAAAQMVAEMSRRQLTFLSCWPDLEMRSFWERTLMPALNFIVFSIFPAPLSLIYEWPSLGIAHGACLMFERKSYFEIGGHAAVRDQIFEDTRLAQLWRSRGARGLCLDGQEIVRVRMYDSFGSIWRGFQKNFYPAFRHEISFWVFIALHLFVFLFPFIWVCLRPGEPALAAVIAIILTRLLLGLHFQQSWWAAFLHPLSEAVLITLGLSSWWKCKSGQGVMWKGREYHKTV